MTTIVYRSAVKPVAEPRRETVTWRERYHSRRAERLRRMITYAIWLMDNERAHPSEVCTVLYNALRLSGGIPRYGLLAELRGDDAIEVI